MRRLRTLYSFATIAALFAVATALAACGGGDSDSDAGEVIDSATLEGVESGKLALAVKVRARGEDGGNLNLDLSGAFQGEGQGELPQLDGTATAKGSLAGERVDFDGGLVLLPNSAYVNYDGTEYEVDPTTYSFVESALQQAQREGGGEGEDGGAKACQEEIAGLQFSEFVENAENEGSADVGGESTTKVGGELNVPALLDQAVEIADSPACSAQVSAAGELPGDGEIDEAKEEVETAVKAATVELFVGEDDVVRRFAGRLRIEPEGGGDGPSRVDLEFDLELTEVNEEQQISAPGGKTRPLSELFIELGVNPIELLGLLQGEGEAADLGNLLEGLGEAAR